MSGFALIVLGCSGGPREGNLSSYLLYDPAHFGAVLLDAGTVLEGLIKADQSGALSDFSVIDSSLQSSCNVLHHHIKAYLISHSHLDHTAGLVISSQIDTPKSIYGLESTISDLQAHQFNWHTWPNLADKGVSPALNLYTYEELQEGVEKKITHTPFSVMSFRLAHPKDYPSSAFVIKNGDKYLAYFGDTSPDYLEKDKRMQKVWAHLAPIHDAGNLSGVLLECSIPNAQASELKYGHLTPQAFFSELNSFKSFTKKSLQGLKVMVTHRKESFTKSVDAPLIIQKELEALNTLGIEFIFPIQGERYIF
jgi:cAMP phosphodiesterase